MSYTRWTEIDSNFSNDQVNLAGLTKYPMPRVEFLMTDLEF